MNVDLHCHTHYSPDCWISPRQRVEEALAAGLHGLAITDHNTLEGALEARAWADDRLSLIVGEEITTRQGELIGLFLSEPIPKGIDVREAAERIHGQGGLVYLPHPLVWLAWERVDRRGRERVVKLVDIVEAINGRNFIARHDWASWAWGAAQGKALAAASDAHSPNELGSAFVSMERFDGPADFLDKLRRGEPVLDHRSSPFWTALSVLYLYPNQLYRSLYRGLYGRSPIKPELP